MKKYYKYFWLVSCLLIVTACSDDAVMTVREDADAEKESVNEDWNLPPLDNVEIKKYADRAMWVSYDPTPGNKGETSGISQALISWRYLVTDPDGVGFNVYKREGGIDSEEKKLNEEPIINSSCWQDATLNKEVANYYRVTMIGTDGEGQPTESETICEYTLTSEMANKFYREIKLTTNVPIPSINYKADDVQVGDLDGDGEMEIVVKREPYDGANQGGWRGSGTTLLEAYKMDGTFLWQIDLGINIRSGSHYTSYVLYDFDGDGRCEIAFRSSEGTRFGGGKTITDAYGKVNDYRIRDDAGSGWYSGTSLYTTCGLIFESPEYISICRGADGNEITRMENIPRGGKGTRKERAEYWQNYWGDDYGNRMDRFFIGVAYLDGVPDKKTGRRTSNPSLIITRGIYHNWQVWAVDLKGNELEVRWKFDTADHSSKWLSMCSHAFRVADLDGDERDEILYGQAAIDSNGSELWCTGNGHGDVLHVGKFIPDSKRKGLQIVASFEESNNYLYQGHGFGCQTIDARDGSLIAGHGTGTADVGRCAVADINPENPGFEYWSSLGKETYSCLTGETLGNAPTGIGGGIMYNVAIYWTGEPTRDLFDRALIVNAQKGRIIRFDLYGSNQGNHSTKFNPCYYGDFLGDYREEVIMGSKDNNSLYIFSTNWPTTHRLHHLLQDHNYDMSQAMQNIGYNQGTNLGYYVGAETMK
ncbi:Rhamnogalacturonan endolyase YesW [Bacteroides finegoldii]|uniref:Uncharacterized protein n=1 Tax=Bacteroides finegoldii CL09T03C10 TaxID=997888 RepID=K5BRX4_9BACE|nr:hypothetical protein [Bacteroides finegoldii]EKJ89492.1 hypothetical protein HMPREF1057_03033 [Bacteroides finegoldii CL09T03C10]